MSFNATEDYSIWVAILAGLLTVALLLTALLRNKIVGKRAKISPVGSFPILGNVLALDESKMLEFMDKSAEAADHKDFEAFAFSRRLLFISNWDTAKFVLKMRPKLFRREKLFESWANDLGLKNGAFNAEDEWSRVRSMTAPSFAPHNIESLFLTITKKCELLVEELQGISMETMKAEKFDGLSYLTTFTLKIFMLLAFGDRNLGSTATNYVEKDMDADMKKLFSWIYRRSTIPVPAAFWHYVMKDKLERDASFSIGRIEKLIKAIIDTYKPSNAPNSSSSENQSFGMTENENENENKSSNSNFLSTLMTANYAAQSGKPGGTSSGKSARRTLSDADLYAQIFSFLIAGSETTSVTTSNILYLLSLSENKQWAEDLRKEVKTVLGTDRFPKSLEQLRRMTLLEATIKESIRLMPVSAGLFFNTASDSKTDQELPGGYIVKSGDGIILNMIGIHRDKAVYKNPLVFNPRRWLDSTPEELLVMDEHFIGFGKGPRICPGQSLANMEGASLLATIYRNYSVDLACDPKEIKFLSKFTTQPSKLPLILTPDKD